MVRAGALTTALALAALLAGVLVHDHTAQMWLLTASIGLCVAGTALLILASR